MKHILILSAIIAILGFAFFGLIDLMSKSMRDTTPPSELPAIDTMLRDQRAQSDTIRREQQRALDENRRQLEENRRKMDDIRRSMNR